MKKFLIAAVLITASAALAQTAPTQQKTIKDPAEYNAYITATQLTDPTQKAAALESFVTTYPNSVVKEDALAAEMAAYQQAGNPDKSAEVAGRVLQTNPNNIPALVVTVYGKMADARKTQNQALANEAGDLAVRGLSALQNWPKPDGTSDADYAKQKTVFASILNNAAGTAALGKKDYPSAQKYYRDAVAANNASADDTYNLALSYLLPKPNTDDNMVNGIWFIARAQNLVAGTGAEKQVADYGSKVYTKYHGAADGWTDVLAQSKNVAMPPAGFTVAKYVPPSPSDQAADMVAKNDIAKMEFADWIFILTSGNQAAADKVWNTLKGKGLAFQGQVIDATKSVVTMAVTADGIEAKKPEVQVTMATPLKVAPVAGANFKVQAAPDTYDPNPFLMKMVDGQDLDKPAPKPPVRRPATTHKKTS